MAAKGKRSLAARVGDFLQASTAGDDGSVDESDVSDEDEFGRASSLERQAGFYPAARDPARAYAPETGKEPGGQKSGAELSSADKAKAIKEVEEFAVYLGMDLAEDRDLLWVAVEAMTAPLPENWSEHNTRNGQPYYYNKRTDHTQWEHPMDEYHRGLYKKLKAEKLKGKTQQQLALAKDEIAHHFAADAARAAADGMSGPRRKSNIVVGNGGMAGAKPGKAADAGLSAGEATAAAQGQGKSSAHKENTKPGSSGKARQVVSVALDSAAMTSPLSSGTAGSTPASSPNDAESAASTQQAAAQRQEELKRKQDKKARLRSKLAAIKGVDAAAGSSEVGSLSPEEKQRLKEREQEKLKSMLQLVKEQRRVAGTLNPRNQPAGGQLDPLLIIGGANAGPAGPAGLARQTSLMGGRPPLCAMLRC